MQTNELWARITTAMNKLGIERTLERLEGMQGPEQGLVGESRSARKQGHAEEAKPTGERGVGEIVELAELRRHVEAEMKEAREAAARYEESDLLNAANYYLGQVSALAALRKRIEDMTEKRSDLSNAASLPPGGAGVSEANVEGAKR